MRFDLVTRDPDALFSMIAKQQRDQAVIKAKDAEHRQTAKRRDARSVAAARTKPQRSAANEHDSCERAKAAGVKAEGNRWYDKNERFVCDKQGHNQWDCPQIQQGKEGKGVHGQSHGQTHTEAAVHKRSCSAPSEQEHRDGPCVCHAWSKCVQDRLKSGGYGDRVCCA